MQEWGPYTGRNIEFADYFANKATLAIAEFAPIANVPMPDLHKHALQIWNLPSVKFFRIIKNIFLFQLTFNTLLFKSWVNYVQI